MYLTLWPAPSLRPQKADLLEILCNLNKEHDGLPYSLEIHVPDRKAVRPVKRLRRARPGGGNFFTKSYWPSIIGGHLYLLKLSLCSWSRPFELGVSRVDSSLYLMLVYAYDNSYFFSPSGSCSSSGIQARSMRKFEIWWIRLKKGNGMKKEGILTIVPNPAGHGSL
jgi:hypothetical protein